MARDTGTIQTRTKAEGAGMINEMIGKFFHDLKSNENEDLELRNQGRIIGNPEPGWYLIETFDFINGGSVFKRLIKFEEMKEWVFYDNKEDLQYGFLHGFVSSILKRQNEEMKKNCGD